MSNTKFYMTDIILIINLNESEVTLIWSDFQWFKNFTYVALKNIYIQDFNSLIQKFNLKIWWKKLYFIKGGMSCIGPMLYLVISCITLLCNVHSPMLKIINSF